MICTHKETILFILKLFILIFILFGASLPSASHAGDSPEVMYQVWIEASRAGDIDKMLSVSSAQKVKEFHQEFTTPEKREELKRLIKVMAPKSYKVRKSELSPEGTKASLWLDALALDFFSLNDPKAKPQKEEIEVRLVKEGGEWKIDQQCGGKGGCGKEPEWQQASFRKPIPLPKGASLKVAPGKASEFKSVALQGKPFVVDFAFSFPESTNLAYFLHRSPNFAEFYILAGGQKIAPIAEQQYRASDSTEEVKVEKLENDFSYSRSRTTSGQGSLTLLFDIPAEAKGSKELYFTVTVEEQKLAYRIPL